jgi:hypothetical protein
VDIKRDRKLGEKTEEVSNILSSRRVRSFILRAVVGVV